MYNREKLAINVREYRRANRHKLAINVREYRRDNRQWPIERNWQHIEYIGQKNIKQGKNTTQYVLDTTMRKQTQIT